MASNNGHNQSSFVKEEVTPKRNAGRSAKAKVKKYGSGEDDDDDDEDIIQGMQESDDNASDYLGSDSETEKKIRKASEKPKKTSKPKSGTLKRRHRNEIENIFGFPKIADSSSPPPKKRVSAIVHHLICIYSSNIDFQALAPKSVVNGTGKKKTEKAATPKKANDEKPKKPRV